MVDKVPATDTTSEPAATGLIVPPAKGTSFGRAFVVEAVLRGAGHDADTFRSTVTIVSL